MESRINQLEALFNSIETAIQEEVSRSKNTEHHNDIIISFLRSMYMASTLDADIIKKDYFRKAYNTIISALKSVPKRDETFLLLIAIVIDTLDCLGTIEIDNQIVKFNTADIFTKLVNLFYEAIVADTTTNTVETHCTLCNKIIKVPKEKADLVHICSACKE
ncbi:MAG: hypothetical protein RMJ67_07770 [Elusimicrobiota bacterium]|nr:hypothetical protein [Endomicrobiia bacterium]MDW8166390.1 hypothetical protein [Elusimicrobiota bacterium]